MQGINRKGFTLLQLVMVVIIIFILFSIALPGYIYYLKLARSAEARLLIDYIADLEESYHIDHGRYTDDINALGFRPTNPLKYYTNPIIITLSNNDQSFLVKVSGNIDSDPELDVWTINEKKEWENNPMD